MKVKNARPELGTVVSRSTQINENLPLLDNDHPINFEYEPLMSHPITGRKAVD